MTLLLVGLAFFLGGFLGCLGMALACAAKDREAFEAGYRAMTVRLEGGEVIEWPVVGLN